MSFTLNKIWFGQNLHWMKYDLAKIPNNNIQIMMNNAIIVIKFYLIVIHALNVSGWLGHLAKPST